MGKAKNKIINLVHSYLKYPLPEGILKELYKELEHINLYPSGGGYSELCQVLATYSGTKIENILPANGSDEVIEMITRAYQGKILIPVPTFSQYEASADRGGFSKLLVNCLTNGHYIINYSSEQLEEASLVWICNPNNPTGTSISREKIIDVLQRAKGMVVVDECYYNYLEETVIDLIDDYPNLIISRSFSKDFGLAGLRLGFMISNSKNIKKIFAFGQYFRINRIAEKSTGKVLKYLDYYKKAWKSIKENRDYFINNLKALGFNVFDSNSNFVFVEFKNENQTKKIWNYLKENNIFTTAAWEDEFSVLESRFIRICIGEKKEMDRVTEVLAEYKHSPK
ncbi:MAG: histidinol-phosphate aminotransferase family protein [Candidatus Atribacteria bacterium]|nr:histidinol-phosphate aminotransferase family protein [Candidatus Atribacteria bacterium]